MNALESLDRARRAWERTSPQLVIDGWLDMLDGLDEAQGNRCGPLVHPALRLVEPVAAASPGPQAAGSQDGDADPGRTQLPGSGTDAQTRSGGHRTATVSSASPASTTTGSAALLIRSRAADPETGA